MRLSQKTFNWALVIVILASLLFWVLAGFGIAYVIGLFDWSHGLSGVVDTIWNGSSKG